MLLFVLDSLKPVYRSAVEDLYFKHKRVMLYTAYGVVKDFGQAEDIVQHAFIRIIKHIDKISGFTENETKGYIIYIVKNLSYDFLRRQKHENTVPIDKIEDTPDESQLLEDIAITSFELDNVKKKLKEMDLRYSLPIILKYSLNFSHAEIADMLEVSEENARVRCHRARLKLIKALKEDEISINDISGLTVMD